MSSPAAIMVALSGGSAAAAFAPTDLASLIGWWDFSDATKLYTDAGTTLVSADAQSVQQVNDKSPSGVNISQATSSFRPTYKVNILNTKSVLRFDGTDNLFTSSATITARFAGDNLPLSVIVVGSTTNLAANPAMWGAARSSSATPFFFLQMRSTGVLRVDKRDDGSVEPFFDSAGSFVAGSTSYILSTISTATTGKSYKNGIAGGTDPGTWASAGVSTIDRFSIGDVLFSGATALPLTGDVAEVLVFNTGLTSAEHNSVGSYLATKYGLTWTTVT